MEIKAKIARKNDVDRVIYDDEIYDRIGDDMCPPKEEFQFPYGELVTIGGYVDDKIASLFIVHKNNEMHFMVLKSYRKYARRLLKASFGLWPFDVWVNIPALYMSVINFSRKNGFVVSEIIKNGHLKGGKLYDCYILKTDKESYGHCKKSDRRINW